MKKNIIQFIGLAVFISFISITISFTGCSGGKQTSTNTTLEGLEWELEALNGRIVADTNGNKVTLILNNGTGKMSGSSTCNKYFGGYKVDGSTLSFSGLGSTKMMCDEMSIETEYFSALSRVDKYEITNEKLKLYRGSKVILKYKKK